MGRRKRWLAVVVGCLVLALPGAAAAAARAPATGMISFSLVHDRTVEEIGGNVVHRLGQITTFQGTIGGPGPLLVPGFSTQVRVFHPSGALTWFISVPEQSIVVAAAGCPSAATLSFEFVGHQRAGETMVFGRFRGSDETGRIHITGMWTITDLSGFPTASYAGQIVCTQAA